MNKVETFNNNLLDIKVTEGYENIFIHWSGKSIDRKPNIFITPILIKLLKKCIDKEKKMILDFSNIEYMNSSTITPIIKILERAKRSEISVKVEYLASLKWQDLIFSALEIFQTKDNRIQIHGNQEK